MDSETEVEAGDDDYRGDEDEGPLCSLHHCQRLKIMRTWGRTTTVTGPGDMAPVEDVLLYDSEGRKDGRIDRVGL